MVFHTIRYFTPEAFSGIRFFLDPFQGGINRPNDRVRLKRWFVALENDSLGRNWADTVKLAGNFAWNAAEKLTFSCYDPTLILCSFPPTSFLLAFKKPTSDILAAYSEQVSLQTHGFPKCLKKMWPHILSHTTNKLLPGRLSKCVPENRWICFYLSRTRGPEIQPPV